MTTQQKMIEGLRKELPAMFTRKVASQKTGGYLAPGTLANMDSRGEGPGGVLMGKIICYERESFLAWLEKRMEAQNG